MKTGDNAKRLRIYISSTDKFEHTPLYELIIFTARKNGITGATVLKGIMGYGASSEIYSNKLWEITEKMPLIVEVIDEPHKIDLLIESISHFFEKSGKGHLITVDETTVVLHKTGAKKGE
jgi:PII-like signaling protein